MSFSFADFACGAFKITRQQTTVPSAWKTRIAPHLESETSEQRAGEIHPKRLLQSPERTLLPSSELEKPHGARALALAMPPKAPLPMGLSDSALGRASKEYARARVAGFTEGGGPMAFNVPEEPLLWQMVDVIDDGLLYGINANTAIKDQRAWEAWEVVQGAWHFSAADRRGCACTPGTQHPPPRSLDDACVRYLPAADGGSGVRQAKVSVSISPGHGAHICEVGSNNAPIQDAKSIACPPVETVFGVP